MFAHPEMVALKAEMRAALFDQLEAPPPAIGMKQGKDYQ